MTQKTVARWLKGIIIGVALCGLIIFGLVVPAIGHAIVGANPEFSYCYLPWLIFICLCALPCYAALVLGWKIAADIGHDRAFTTENAKRLKYITVLAVADAMFFFTGNVVFLLLNMNHPGIALLSLIVVFAGIAIAIAAAALSYLVKKAAALQEQSDWTI